MDVGINNVIYVELHSGPKMANGTCRKMIVAGTIDQGSTVYTHTYRSNIPPIMIINRIYENQNLLSL